MYFGRATVDRRACDHVSDSHEQTGAIGGELSTFLWRALDVFQQQLSGELSTMFGDIVRPRPNEVVRDRVVGGFVSRHAPRIPARVSSPATATHAQQWGEFALVTLVGVEGLWTISGLTAGDQ